MSFCTVRNFLALNVLYVLYNDAGWTYSSIMLIIAEVIWAMLRRPLSGTVEGVSCAEAGKLTTRNIMEMRRTKFRPQVASGLMALRHRTGLFISAVLIAGGTTVSQRQQRKPLLLPVRSLRS